MLFLLKEDFLYNSYNCLYVPVDPPNKLTLTRELEGVADWKKLATFLLDDVDGSIVYQIERNNHFIVEDCQGAMIDRFLQQSDDISWRKVIESLKIARYTNIAKKIEHKL